MTPQGSFGITALAVLLLVVLLNMLRKRRISEDVCLIWIVALVGVILLMVVPGFAEWGTRLVGAVYPASALTLFALAFIGAMLMYTSVKVSRLSWEVRALAQRQALAEADRDSHLEPGENGPPM